MNETGNESNVFNHSIFGQVETTNLIVDGGGKKISGSNSEGKNYSNGGITGATSPCLGQLQELTQVRNFK